MSDERDLMESRVNSLTEELHQTHEELLGIRRENVSKISQMKKQLDEKNENVRNLVRVKDTDSLDRFIYSGDLNSELVRYLNG